MTMNCPNCFETMRGPFYLAARKRDKYTCGCGKTIETKPRKKTGISPQKLAAIRKNRSLEYFGEKEVKADGSWNEYAEEVRLPSEQTDED